MVTIIFSPTVHISLYLSIYLSIYLSLYLSIYLTISLSIYLGVVEHDGKLYVLGGRGGLGSVEVYDPEEDAWQILEEKLLSVDQEYSAVILDRVV